MKQKKNTYIMTIIGITFITMVGILGMLPQEKAILPFLTGLEEERVEDSTGAYLYENPDEEYVIDDTTLDRFIQVYVEEINGKNNENLNYFDKQEVRLLLEDMGYYNTTKLRDVLSQEDVPVEGDVSSILEENLFDYDFERLDKILGLED